MDVHSQCSVSSCGGVPASHDQIPIFSGQPSSIGYIHRWVLLTPSLWKTGGGDRGRKEKKKGKGSHSNIMVNAQPDKKWGEEERIVTCHGMYNYGYSVRVLP